MPGRAVAAFVAFLSAAVAANLLTDAYGLVPVGFGLTATAGTFAAGAALFTRDALHDAGGRRLVALAIGGGAALSALFAPSLALASAAAFVTGETLDTIVYAPLRRRSWTGAVLASNVVGAIVDTAVFLAIAGYPVTSGALAGQALVKIGYLTLGPVAAVRLAAARVS